VQRLPVAGPWITEKEVGYVADAAAHAWYENANVWHPRFEAALAAYTARRFAIALPSCTAAIHLALACAGVGPGDEVVLPESTWIASAAPVSYLGAQPVFADVERSSWCLAPGALAAALTPRTRAILVVDLYGNMPDMGALLALAARARVPLIEDAAESIGSSWSGRRAGSFGLASTFSFHGSKTITTGEGGMLLTDDEQLYRRALLLRDHGRAAGPLQFWNTEVAYKYKMSSMQAALGLAQMERVEEILARKRAIFGWYREEFAGVAGLELNPEPEGVLNSYWMVTLILDESRRASAQDLMQFLALRGMDSRPFFHPLSSLPAYAGTPAAAGARERNPVAYSLAPRGLNLPSALRLAREDIARVGAAVREFLSACPRPGT
jgi:perosamine synthetase